MRSSAIAWRRSAATVSLMCVIELISAHIGLVTGAGPSSRNMGAINLTSELYP